MARRSHPANAEGFSQNSPKFPARTVVSQLRDMQILLRTMRSSSERLIALSEHARHLVVLGSIGRKPKPKYAPGIGMFGTPNPRTTLTDQLDYFDDRILILRRDLDFFVELIDEALDHVARRRF